MGFYEDKKQAFLIIDEMFTRGETEEKIIFKISTSFGFSKKMVSERLNLLRDLAK